MGIGVVNLSAKRQRLFAIFLLVATPSVAAELAGRVVGIADCDSFTLLTSDKQ